MAPNGDDWPTWSKYVVEELKDNKKWHEKHSEKLTLVRIDIRELKLKCGVWGVVGGAIPVAIGFAVWFLKG